MVSILYEECSVLHAVLMTIYVFLLLSKHNVKSCMMFVRVAHSNVPNTLQYVRVIETNMATRCSRRVRAYSMNQLRVHSICLISEGDMIEACYARVYNG